MNHYTIPPKRPTGRDPVVLAVVLVCLALSAVVAYMLALP